MDTRYSNTSEAVSAREVNALCGYPENMRHLVLFRNPRDWLDSIYRWGLQNAWFANEESFFDQALYRSYLAEWHEFYAAWASFSQADPDLVKLISYDDLKQDTLGTIARIDDFCGVTRSVEFTLPHIGAVRHSAPMDEKRVGLIGADIDAAAQSRGKFDWQEKTTYASEKKI